MVDRHRSAPHELNEGLKINRVELLPDVDRVPINLQIGSLSVPLDVVDAIEPVRVTVGRTHPMHLLLNKRNVRLERAHGKRRVGSGDVLVPGRGVHNEVLRRARYDRAAYLRPIHDIAGTLNALAIFIGQAPRLEMDGIERVRRVISCPAAVEVLLRDIHVPSSPCPSV